MTLHTCMCVPIARNSVAIKLMRKQCVPGALSSPFSVPGNKAISVGVKILFWSMPSGQFLLQKRVVYAQSPSPSRSGLVLAKTSLCTVGFFLGGGGGGGGRCHDCSYTALYI